MSSRRDDVLARFQRVRERSLSLAAPLSAEDAQVQPMPDASPTKWHLAHTSWFFETFVLVPLGERPIDPSFAFLFNSYYEAKGARVERARRGLLTRPDLKTVLAYRAEIDQRVAHALVENRLGREALEVIDLGIAHEEQHQELMLTDAKYVLGTQPLQPAYRTDLEAARSGTAAPSNWVDFEGGIVEIGARAGELAFDCERPRHRVLVEPYRLATRPLCNGEVLAFIDDGGYDEASLWLSDGWATIQLEGWRAPLYWEERDGVWFQYTLGGVREVDPAETACHLSYYEADAIARWSCARLPTEAEWEHAASGVAIEGHFADDDRLHPRAADRDGLRQLFGDVWEWTQSAYAPYPGFRPLPGALGEYNGKFMSSQLVLRGGSCLTPRGHVRASYRNFFPPSARWQMTGVRLAADGGLS
ncbi:MAG: ergothioneine biosynthesis protein EgtB [Kofleriaceae bacterium]|nr:ergothioneine biosynthesis protein EgtB [Kofleriaceae bacterium]